RRRGLHQDGPDRLPGRALAVALEESEGGVRLLSRRHGNPVPQAILGGRPARAIPALLGLYGRRDLDPGGEARGARAARDALLEPGPEEPGEREIRRGLPQEVRQDAGVLRRAELR